VGAISAHCQQALHGLLAGDVVCDLLHDPALGTGQGKGQDGQQAFMQALAARGQGRCPQAGALTLRLQLRELLREQLLELQALPARVTAVFQRGQRCARGWVMQEVQGLAQGRKTRRDELGRQDLVQVGPPEARGHRLAQIGLGQRGAGGIDRRERGGQWRALAHRPEAGVDDLAAEEAAPQLTAGTHALAHGQGLLVVGVEAEEAQQHRVAAIVERDLQLPPRAQHDFAARDEAFDLHCVAVACIGQAGQPGLVLVAQRQVQRQVDVAHQAQFLQGFLGGGLFLLRLGADLGHGTILPLLSRFTVGTGRSGPQPPCPTPTP
jgi:hypothetical protein